MEKEDGDDDDDSLNGMMFVMSSEESSVAELVFFPAAVQKDQQQEGLVQRVRHGRLRLRQDQWLYESLPDDGDRDNHSSTKDEKQGSRTESQHHQDDEGGRQARGKGEKGTPSGGGNGNGNGCEEGNTLDAVLLLCVKGVLAGVQGFWLLQWMLGRLSDALTKVVEFGLLLLGQPTE